jgi:hypothetical protein
LNNISWVLFKGQESQTPEKQQGRHTKHDLLNFQDPI